MSDTPQFQERTAILLGEEALERLGRASVAVYGLGGVGAACAVDLVRAGIGTIRARDFDTVSEGNLNRLVFGLSSTVGKRKTEVFAEWARQINPEVQVLVEDGLISGEGAREAILEDCDFHIDCIDTLNAKANLIAALVREGLPFASSMGTAGRLDPLRLRFGSLWKTAGCPLARSVRQRLRKFGVPKDARVDCVWSDEEAAPPGDWGEATGGRPRRLLGTAPFVPQTAGHILASVAVRHILSMA